MNAPSMPFGTKPPPVLHPFQFRGTGSEFFRIWIVNIALTLITLGIFSAWAKVRTRRYFYGNTYVAEHAFDYHAVPWRILVGRIIALGLFGAYNFSVNVAPYLVIVWVAAFAAAIPWLIVSSQRFNARNTSYRNVRFNFTGTYWGAFKAFILWPLAGIVTLGTLWPLAHRARDYYYVNYHSYGGKHFATSFSRWSIYKIYLQALLLLIGLIIAAFAVGAVWYALANHGALAQGPAARGTVIVMATTTGGLVSVSWLVMLAYIAAKTMNLAADNTALDGRHRLGAALSPWQMVWIGVSNIILVLVTVGFFYPWARVRYSQYLADHMSLLAASDLDEFTSEALVAKSAIGEEIAGLFAFDFGL
jgi:uncharacterized membrane protein YjgN (DUF898 family)